MRHHNLHTFVQIVSESVRWCSIKKLFLFIKFTETWGIGLVSLNKNRKFLKILHISGAHLKPIQTSMTGRFAKIVDG